MLVHAPRRGRQLAGLAAVAALGAMSLLSLGLVDAEPAAGQSVVWDVHWNDNVQGKTYTASPSLGGRAAYADSGYGVTATVTFSSNLGAHEAACITTPTFELAHDRPSSPPIRNDGLFDGVNPGVRCNGTYAAVLRASDPLSPTHPTSPLNPFTYTHASTGVGTPTVKAGSDGTSLVVTWAAPADVTPDLVGYHVKRTFQPAAGGAPAVKEADVSATSFSEQVGSDYGGYSYTVQARYWGTGGPGSAEILSDPSGPAQASVAKPSPGRGDTVTPGTGSTGAGGTGTGGAGKPVINTAPGAGKGFFPIPNVPRTEAPNIAIPAIPGISTGTTETLDPQRLDTPEPGGPEAIKPKTPLSATAMVDHPSGGGLNGRTVAIVAASVLVLGLIAAQLAFLSRRAAALELLPEDPEP